MAREYFEEWFPVAMQRYELAKHATGQGFLKPAAFDMHQTAEFLYHCVLLVCTFYTPHVHNLGFLRTQAERLDRRLFHVWPRDTKKERALFEKLKEAYVKARYSRLCRTRHNRDYAECATMPSGRGTPVLSRNLAVIGSA